MKAADVMTRDVISIEADASVLQAARLMLAKRISGLPVVDATGRLVGIVTEGDFLRRGELDTQRHRPRWLEFLIGPGRLASEYVKACGRKVHEIMTPDVHTISEDTPLAEVARIMEKQDIKRVPVVRDGALVGIVSRANLLRALASVARKAPPHSADDKAIRERFAADLKAQPWAPAGSIDAIVQDGTVDLWGTILDERQREAIRVLAENIPGVRAVHDHLVWIEPLSGMAVTGPEEASAAQDVHAKPAA
jgi:CBS domain-containing protein